MKKIFTLTCLLLCCAVLLCACGDTPKETTPPELTYQVTVTDAQGAPCTGGVVVKFLKDGKQAAMQTMDETGTAAKALPTGEYTVELMFTDANAAYYYDKTDLTLTPEKTAISVSLLNTVGSDAQQLYVDSQQHAAYAVGVGSTHVTLEPGRNYFLFTPTQGGTYEFSAAGADNAIGYYGAPHFVQSASAAETVDGVITLSVKNSMIGTDGAGTSTFVLGIDADAAGETTLSVIRTGDPAWDPSDEPWTVYQTTAELSEYALPEGAQTVDFDLTAATDAYKLVFNEDDGSYHLNTADGPQVLVYLGEPSRYLDALEIVAEKSGVNKYFYDENGNFLRKESYNACLMEYFAYMCEDSGLYPLTKDLEYIIRQHGEDYGWFDPSDVNNYLFRDANGVLDATVNPEIAWLFLCCYIAN